MAEAKPECLGFFIFVEVLKKIILKKSQLKIPILKISVFEFCLNACFVRQFILKKGVDDIIVLVGVVSPPICFKVGITDAEGSLFVDA